MAYSDEDGMDPWLRLAVLAPAGVVTTTRRALHGGGSLPDPGNVRIDVLAELKDPAQGVPPQLESPPHQSGKRIRTGWVARDAIAALHRHPNIKRLELATLVRPQLDKSVKSINATQAEVEHCFGHTVTGAGVIVGIVDTGCDFLHPNFLKPSSRETRLLSLWDQSVPARPAAAAPDGYGYGREFTAADINRAIATADKRGMEAAFEELDYTPEEMAHGTHVMDIAAGNGQATHVDNPGVAPGVELIFVQLPLLEIAQPTLIANSRHVLDAVEYIFKKAGERAQQLGRPVPAVVNLSLAAYSGPHDGTAIVDAGIEELLAHPSRAVVAAAGNGYDECGSHHRRKTIAPHGRASFGWIIKPTDPTTNSVEFWYPANRDIRVWLEPPAGSNVHPMGPVAPGGHRRVEVGEDVVGEVLHRARDAGNGCGQILIVLAPTRMTAPNLVASAAPPSGQWTIVIENHSGTPVTIDGWIERDDYLPDFDAQQSRFDATSYVAASDGSITLGNFACSPSTIAVAGYNCSTGKILETSSAGPTRMGAEKPDIAAPGASLKSTSYDRRGIKAASATEREPMRDWGTSMAAAHVTGQVALLFAAALLRQRVLTTAEIRTLVISTARRPGHDAAASSSPWDPRFGRGEIDVCASLRKLREWLGAAGSPLP